MSAPATPRPAATVILLRPLHDEDADGAFEIFMVKRHGKSAFMANAYVYPGGRVDEDDAAPEVAAVCTGFDAEAAIERMPGVDDVDEARALLVAGVREAFEEAGVLLAHERGDARRDPIAVGHDVELAARFDDWRRRVHDQHADLVEMAEAESLCFALDWLMPFAHWITPEVEPRRYDTWFLVARCPCDQDLAHDEKETVDSAWVTPDQALDRYDAGELQLAPPTWRTLRELRELGTLGAVVEHCRQTTIVPIMPHFVGGQDGLVLLLPGDPDFPDPDAAPVEGATRIELRDGRWWQQ